ncbi:MAG: rod shape-determining protein MreD [Coriobacteriia bacterium]|nr:rod shape-determining protein MreD [Coriobacteriia bacterium]
MNPSANSKTTVLGFIVAFVLQVAIAPNLAIAGVAADVALCFVVANAMRVSQTSATVSSFVLGALVDLASGSPLGIRAMTYCLVAYAISPVSTMTMTNSTSTRYIALSVALFVGEFLIALFMSIIGYDIDLVHSLVSKVIPGGLYDMVAALVFLPLLKVSNTQAGYILSTKPGSSLKDKLPPI